MKFLVYRFLPSSDRRAIRQSIWMGAMLVVQFTGGIVHLSITARVLGPEGYGVLSIFIAVTSLLYNFLAMPGGEVITTYVTRSMAAGRWEEATATLRFALAAALGLRLISYSVLVVFALTANGFLGVERAHATTLIVFGVAGVLLATRAESFAVLRLADRLSLGLVVVSAGTLVRIALLLFTWRSGGGLPMIVLAYVADAAVTGVGMFVAASVSAPTAGLSGFLRSISVRVPRDVINFQIATFGRATTAAVGQSMDVLLMVELSSMSQIGLYRAARSIIDSARLPFRPLMTALQLEFSKKWYSADRNAIRGIAFRFTLFSGTVAAIGFGLLAAFHEPVMRILLGSGFSGSARPLLILIIGSFVATSTSVLSVLPAAVGRGGPPLVAALSGVLVSVGVILWLIPLYGAEGAAWANTAYFVVFVAVLIPPVVSILRRSHRVSGERMHPVRS